MKQERGANGAVLIQIKKSQEFSEHSRDPLIATMLISTMTESLVTNMVSRPDCRSARSLSI